MPTDREALLVRRLGPADAAAFMALRRAALLEAPLAFISSPEDDVAGSLEFVEEALAASDQATFGAFAEELVGIVGVGRQQHLKASHKCEIWGLYVRPDARSVGAGRALVLEALSFAASLAGVTHVYVGATERAPEAASLYRSMGFVPWGVEPAALKVDEILVSETHLSRAVSGDPARGEHHRSTRSE
jgi:ribosomal protein S18 acetylase RimI-like enzyme